MTEIIDSSKTGHVYIVDAVPVEERHEKFQLRSPHEQKNHFIRKLFQEHFDYEIHDVTFPPRSKPQAVLDFFEDELETRTEGELMIVYFDGDGSGGENGEDYSWQFSGFPRSPIDAYALIEMLVDSGIDCMMLLDCYIPGRFHRKWKPSRGNFEILATGQPLQHFNGNRVANDPGDFTHNLVRLMDRFVQGIDTPAKEGGFAGWHAPLSIPRLLTLATEMSDNPRRVWITRPKQRYFGKSDQNVPLPIIHRYVLLPDKIRASPGPKKAEFFAKRVQSPEELYDDEGLGDMADVEKGVEPTKGVSNTSGQDGGLDLS